MSDNLKEQGRGVQASLKAMTAAQKKAEQLGTIHSEKGSLIKRLKSAFFLLVLFNGLAPVHSPKVQVFTSGRKRSSEKYFPIFIWTSFHGECFLCQTRVRSSVSAGDYFPCSTGSLKLLVIKAVMRVVLPFSIRNTNLANEEL